MKTHNATRKGRILSVEVITRQDFDQDTSTIGEYTDTASPAAIVAETGEFYADIQRREMILEKLADRVDCLKDAGENWTIPHNRLCRLLSAWEDCNRIPGGREHRFFVPYAGGETPGGKEWRKYARKDFDRMQSYNRGNWCYVGIMAQAEVTLPGSTVIQRITSGELWGIESDCEEDLEEFAREELAALREELTAAGFGKRQIAEALWRSITLPAWRYTVHRGAVQTGAHRKANAK